MKENNSNDRINIVPPPTPPPLSDQEKIIMLEQMVRNAPNEEIKQKMQEQLAELNKKNN
jgi:hypothetical protein